MHNIHIDPNVPRTAEVIFIINKLTLQYYDEIYSSMFGTKFSA